MLVMSVLSVLAAGVQAQVYKCIDAGGKTTYLQAPCPSGSKSTAVSRVVPPAPPPPAPATGESTRDKGEKAVKAIGPKSAAELEQEFRKRRLEQGKAQEKETQKLADTQAREENCRNARLQIVSLDSGVRGRVNEKGERYVLDDAQVEQAKASAQKLVGQWCK